MYNAGIHWTYCSYLQEWYFYRKLHNIWIAQIFRFSVICCFFKSLRYFKRCLWGRMISYLDNSNFSRGIIFLYINFPHKMLFGADIFRRLTRICRYSDRMSILNTLKNVSCRYRYLDAWGLIHHGKYYQCMYYKKMSNCLRLSTMVQSTVTPE